MVFFFLLKIKLTKSARINVATNNKIIRLTSLLFLSLAILFGKAAFSYLIQISNFKSINFSNDRTNREKKRSQTTDKVRTVKSNHFDNFSLYMQFLGTFLVITNNNSMHKMFVSFFSFFTWLVFLFSSLKSVEKRQKFFSMYLGTF